MKRIAILTSSYPMNEGDVLYAPFLPPFAEALRARGAEVVVITHARAGEPASPIGSVPIERFPGGPSGRLRDLSPRRPENWPDLLRYFSAAVSAIGAAHRGRGIDYLLAAWALPAGLVARIAHARWGISYGVWALGTDVNGYDGSTFGRTILRRVLRPAAHCFADDPEMAERVASLAGRPCRFLATSRVLPPASTGRIPPRGRVTFRVLFLGRLSEEKGPRILLEALRRAPFVREGDWEALWVGDGPLRAELEDRARAAGLSEKMRFLGARPAPEVAEAIASSDCLIIPSLPRGDTIPLVFSEGIRAGIPILASEVGGMGRMLATFRPAWVLRPGDPDALARALADRRADGSRPVYPAALVAPFHVESSVDRFLEAIG